jgi:dGTPase
VTESRYDRRHGTRKDRPGDQRSEGRRDRDRILYASAFRRLSGITQVISSADRLPIHNRLTHTLEVAQIGRSIAEMLLRDEKNVELADAMGGLDPDIVEAACLAHDLGHPPFGHVTEDVLNSLVTGKNIGDGFEGNAQSFRVVTKLSVRDHDFEGLNLTRATLAAILKYPWRRGENEAKPKKWGAYGSESDDFAFARELRPARNERTLEAALMDWADDIAYAVHDVEDFYRANVIPLELLSVDPEEQEVFLKKEVERQRISVPDEEKMLRDAFSELIALSPMDERYHGTRLSRARLRNFTSSFVERYINATSLESDGHGRAQLHIDPQREMEVNILKGLTWHYVIKSPALISQRYGQRQLIASLFNTLIEASESMDDRDVLPAYFRESLGESKDEAVIVRTVADYISSMTETQVVEMHHRLTGISFGGSLDPIVS